MKITASIFGLTKNNNGFFKSEKQAKFLISQIKKFEGCVGHANNGYHSCPIFAKYDEKGITKLTKHGKNGNLVIFERKVDGVLTSIESRDLKKYKRRYKALKKEVDRRQESFDSGNYNRSGDVSTYTDDMIKLFNEQQGLKVKRLENLGKVIEDLERQA